MSSKPNLEDYIEVPDRIRQFFERYPEGSLRRKDWHMETVGDRTFVVYTAQAYRTPDDKRPAEGTAWEPFPGKTPYTKDSELMNAETSAWGRALVALGFVGKKVASREEVVNRQEPSQPSSAPPAGLDGETVEELFGAAQVARQAGMTSQVLAAHLVASGAGLTWPPEEVLTGNLVMAALRSLPPEGAGELRSRLQAFVKGSTTEEAA